MPVFSSRGFFETVFGSERRVPDAPPLSAPRSSDVYSLALLKEMTEEIIAVASSRGVIFVMVDQSIWKMGEIVVSLYKLTQRMWILVKNLDAYPVQSFRIPSDDFGQNK